jgi:hypothetical protein
MTMIEITPAFSDDFEAWLNGRPKWLQTAARMLIDSKRLLTQDEIQALARLCKLEAKGEADPGFLTVTPGTLAQVANRPLLRIEEILDVHGLNAIKAGANLPFGKSNLSVIYGQNGTGIPNISMFVHFAGDAIAGDISTLPGGPDAQQREAHRARAVAEVTGSDGAVARSVIETVNGYTYTPLVAVEAARRVLAGKRRPGFETPAKLLGVEFAESIAGTTITDL